MLGEHAVALQALRGDPVACASASWDARKLRSTRKGALRQK